VLGFDLGAYYSGELNSQRAQFVNHRGTEDTEDGELLLAQFAILRVLCASVVRQFDSSHRKS